MAIASEQMTKAGTLLLGNRSSVPSFKPTTQVGFAGKRRDFKIGLEPPVGNYIPLEHCLVVQWGHCNLNYGSGNETKINLRYTTCRR
jgi:hypothetical protein